MCSCVIGRLFQVLLVLLVAGDVWAGALTFESAVVEIPVEPDKNEVSVRFLYENQTGGPVDVVEFRTGCGACLSVGPKRMVESGGKGHVDALFKVGSKSGAVEKSVTVVMADASGARSEQVLTLRAVVPELVVVSEKKLQWRVGEAGVTRSVEVTMDWESPIRVMAATSTRKNMEVRVVEVVAGQRYRIDVTPFELQGAQLGMIRIETDCPIEKYRKHVIFAQVTR
ncbi:DUF1573 domain-containing protein [Sulfuriroseicoccus oceanibius]|nr:DUF1573 domain-containing protein [Sulfuriroseicoccus oceanibius]